MFDAFDPLARLIGSSEELRAWEARDYVFLVQASLVIVGGIVLMVLQTLQGLVIWRAQSAAGVSASLNVCLLFFAIGQCVHGAYAQSVAVVADGILTILPGAFVLIALARFQEPNRVLRKREWLAILSGLGLLSVMLYFPEYEPLAFLLLGVPAVAAYYCQYDDLVRRNDAGSFRPGVTIFYLTTNVAYVLYAIAIGDALLVLLTLPGMVLQVSILKIARRCKKRDEIQEAQQQLQKAA